MTFGEVLLQKPLGITQSQMIAYAFDSPPSSSSGGKVISFGCLDKLLPSSVHNPTVTKAAPPTIQLCLIFLVS